MHNKLQRHNFYVGIVLESCHGSVYIWIGNSSKRTIRSVLDYDSPIQIENESHCFCLSLHSSIEPVSIN